MAKVSYLRALGNLFEHSRKRKSVMDVPPEELDLQGLGHQYDIPNLGPLSELEEVAPGVIIPGGVSPDVPMTYEDMLYIKANPFDRDALSREQKVELQKRMLKATTPNADNDVDVFNRYVFGMLSPNQPLTPNEMEAAVVRARDPADIEWWASQIPWKPGEKVSVADRKAVNDRLAEYFETQARSKGGMGLKGTANYANLAELAAMYRQNPDFFKKSQDEDWSDFMQRISSQVPGMSSKVGSFATVWQNPAEASISAIDRHMARKFFGEGGMFPTKKAQKDWERNVVKLWNDVPDNKKVRGFNQLMQTEGGAKHFMSQVMSSLGARESMLRTQKGEFGKNVPEHLKQTDWVVEPEKIQIVSDAYRNALAANEKAAQEAGLNLFGSQWMLWDDLRRRTEPHEIMFPGTEKLPPMSRQMLEASRQAHKDAGYMSGSKYNYIDPETGDLEKRMAPVRPTDDYRKLAYWGAGGAAPSLALGPPTNEAEAQEYTQRILEESPYMFGGTKSGMSAAPEAPGIVTQVRRALEGIETGGGLGDPEAIIEYLKALEQGRDSGYMNKVLTAMELTDPMVLGAILRQMKTR